jgi:hypothetical protein
MENGLMTIEKTEGKTKAFFFDQDVLECARLNLRTKKRIGKYEKARAAKTRRRKNIEKTAKHIAALAASAVGVAVAGAAGMISPYLWVPASIISLCAACLRLGAFLGRGARK